MYGCGVFEDVFVSHAERLVPVHERFFDRFTFRVMADEAFALVAFEALFIEAIIELGQTPGSSEYEESLKAWRAFSGSRRR